MKLTNFWDDPGTLASGDGNGSTDSQVVLGVSLCGCGTVVKRYIKHRGEETSHAPCNDVGELLACALQT